GQFCNGLDLFLEKHEGLMGLALASSDPGATHAAWQAAGLATAEFRPLRRLLEGKSGDLEVAFENVMLDRGETAGLSLFACHHLTPEKLRQPGWTRHPVTATRLNSVTTLVRDPEAMAERLEAIFGRSAITRTDEVIAAHAGHTVMLFARVEDAVMLHPAFDLEADDDTPLLTVLEIAVRDIDEARRFLDLQGVEYGSEPDGSLTIQPDDAFGVAIELTPEG
ncbi:MAG: VOC family protein, partial [Geminicoccaceae bacterium]